MTQIIPVDGDTCDKLKTDFGETITVGRLPEYADPVIESEVMANNSRLDFRPAMWLRSQRFIFWLTEEQFASR
jgi:hypothetical protein